jgi:hypothetical protein
MRTATLICGCVAAAFLGLCALCPLSNTVLLRPILAIFDSRYVRSAEPMPFDPDLWRAGKARHRLGMAHVLVEKKLLDGKTRAELVEMLGEPDIDELKDEGMKWFIGFYPKGLFDETLWLELTIGEKGTAHGAGIGVHWTDLRDKGP